MLCSCRKPLQQLPAGLTTLVSIISTSSPQTLNPTDKIFYNCLYFIQLARERKLFVLSSQGRAGGGEGNTETVVWSSVPAPVPFTVLHNTVFIYPVYGGLHSEIIARAWLVVRVRSCGGHNCGIGSSRDIPVTNWV